MGDGELRCCDRHPFLGQGSDGVELVKDFLSETRAVEGRHHPASGLVDVTIGEVRSPSLEGGPEDGIVACDLGPSRHTIARIAARERRGRGLTRKGVDGVTRVRARSAPFLRPSAR